MTLTYLSLHTAGWKTLDIQNRSLTFSLSADEDLDALVTWGKRRRFMSDI